MIGMQRFDEVGRHLAVTGRLALLLVVCSLVTTPGARARSSDDLVQYDLSSRGGGSGADRVQLTVEQAYPVLLAGASQQAFVRIGLRGSDLEPADRRVPVNVSFVIDRSGSMSGQKLEDAKQAALMGIERLSDDDIVSVVAYDSTVSVPLPPTRAKDRVDIEAAIRGIRSGGNTALFAGVSQGAEQLRRFLDRNQVNRVILLSDGLANVGPSSPGELASLGWSLSHEGISVTTIGLGLGYNEDLMVQLAQGGSGFHYFAEDSSELARIFDYELGNARSVVAQEVWIRIHCRDGVRPRKIYGRDGVIDGQVLSVDLSQLYAGFENYVLVELDVPSLDAGEVRPLVDVTAGYRDLTTREQDQQEQSLTVRGTASVSDVARNVDADVMVAVTEYLSAEQYQLAMDLRDQGETERARQILRDNAGYIGDQAETLGADQLYRLQKYNVEAAEGLDEATWDENRKRMKQRQYMLEQNNVY